MINGNHTPLPPVRNAELPRIIHQMVEAANCPRGHERKVAETYARFIDQFTEGLAKRMMLPLNSVELTAVEYQHAIMDPAKPKFPQGYPVIGIHFNETLIAVTGITFEGTKCTMTHAETASAQFLLRPIPKWLRTD